MYNNNVEIVEMTMVPVKVPLSFRRGSDISLNNRDLDILGEQYAKSGVSGLQSDWMAKAIPSAVTYTHNALDSFELPNGNDIDRFNFKIVTRSVESSTPEYTVTAEYIITGYCDHSLMSNQGELDKNMVLYFTRLSGVAYTHHTSTGGITSRKLMDSEILRSPHTDLTVSRGNYMRMNPQDMLSGLTMKSYNGELSERALMVNSIGDSTLLSPTTSNNAFDTMSGTLSSYLSQVTSDDPMMSTDDMLINATNSASTATMNSCPFLSKLMVDTGISGLSALTWGDLIDSFPDIESKTTALISNGVDGTDAFLTGNDAGGANILASTASMAVDLALANMVRYNLTSLAFTMSNMTHTGEITYGVTGTVTPRVSTDVNIIMESADKFLYDFSVNAFSALTKNMFNMTIAINISQISATVNIEIDGYGYDTIVIPIVTHNLMTPAYGSVNEYSKKLNTVESVIKLMD